MTEVKEANVRVNGGWVDHDVLRCMLCLSSIDQVSKINIHASLDAIVATRPKMQMIGLKFVSWKQGLNQI